MTTQADFQFERELLGTAVILHGTAASADYKHYVLPLLFLRYLFLVDEQRKAEVSKISKDLSSICYICYFVENINLSKECPNE